MRVETHEWANGTIVTGPWLDRPAPRRPSPLATNAKDPKPQQAALTPASPPTVMLTHLKPDATGRLAPRASVARLKWVRDRSKSTIFRALQDSTWGCRLVTRSTSRTRVAQFQGGMKITIPQPNSLPVCAGRPTTSGTSNLAPSRRFGVALLLDSDPAL